MLKNRKGFTLVEIVVTLAIVGFIIIMISQFLLTNMDNYNRAQDDIDAQDTAHKVVEYLTQHIMESTGTGTNSILDSSGVDIKDDSQASPVAIKEITFNKFDASYIKYTYDNSTKILTATDSSNKQIFQAINITSFKFSPLPNNIKFTDPNIIGLQFIIESTVKNKTVSLSNDIYFRDEY